VTLSPGMGGDQPVAALAGDDFDERHGDDVSPNLA
jgi:hypothetical protein